MSPYQWTRQVVYKLGNAKWPVAGGEYIVSPGNALVTPADPLFTSVDANMPFVLVHNAGEEYHPEIPELVEKLTLDVGVFAAGALDKGGQSTVIGGLRTGPAGVGGLGSSEGRGALEVARELRKVLRDSGLGPRPRPTEAPPMKAAEGSNLVALYTMRVIVTRCTADDQFHGLTRLAGTTTTPPTPAAPALSEFNTGQVTAGAHYAQISYFVNGAEGPLSPASNTVTFGANAGGLITLSVTPAPAGVTAIGVYLTHAGGSTPYQIVVVPGVNLTASQFGIPDGNLTVPYAPGIGIAMSWTNPADRYDTVGIVGCYVSGSTPPTSPTQAGTTPITGFAPYVASAVNSIFVPTGTGTWSIALWAAYDEMGSGQNLRYSDVPVTFTGTV